jgi:hypothetical protein
LNRRPAAALGAVLLITLSGCSSTGASPADIVGRTFAEADPDLPENAQYLVQDVSVEFDQKPSYNADQFGSSQWTVLASCSDEDTLQASSVIEIAVAPTSEVGDQEVEAARNGEYADLVTCDF